MKYTYIFDTSALKGIPRTLIEEAKKKAIIAVSPLSIYEFMCHIDETKENENTFARRKGNLLKCDLFEMLPDLFAFLSMKTGINVHKTRFEESCVLEQVLTQLKTSNTLADFYSKHINFTDDEIGDIKDFGLQARKVFNDENAQYITHIESLHKKILSNLGYANLDSHAFFKICACGVNSLNNENIVETFSATYIYAGYKLARLLEYKEIARKNKTKLNIDKNDTEDSLFCLYLDLDQPNVLVTEDKGTINAVNKSIEHIEKNNKWTNNCLARVIKLDEFYKTVEIAA